LNCEISETGIEKENYKKDAQSRKKHKEQKPNPHHINPIILRTIDTKGENRHKQQKTGPFLL